MLSPTDMLDKVAIGNDAGWALAFYREQNGTIVEPAFRTITRDDYEADIEATLPSDLAGGSYRFVIEGLIDADYQQISQFDRSNPLNVRLYLFWRDTNASPAGYLANLAGVTGLVGGIDADTLKQSLVAELAVTKVSRQTGTTHYRTTIEAQERVFRRLADKPLADSLQQTGYLATLQKLCQQVGITVMPFGFGPDGAVPAPQGSTAGGEQVAGTTKDTFLSVTRRIGESLEHAFRKYGRGMFLIQDGKLLAGARDIPMAGLPASALSFTNGYVHSEKLEPDRHPNGTDGPDDDGGAPVREQWKILLKGRPDLKPGAVITFHPDPNDASTTTPSVLGALAGSFLGPVIGADESALPSITVYVSAVEHKLGRRAGFITTITGLKTADDSSDVWDTTPPQDSAPAPGATGARGATASGTTEAAKAVEGLVQQVAGQLQLPEVGEVRSATIAPGSSPEPAAQTEKLWRGTAPPDGNPFGARRLAIRRHQPSALDGVPYASPFAWGKCGLVLPRYPGTRVVFVARNGVAADPIDVGAVWESGQGPAKAQAGDWWLILPVGVASSARSSIADAETPPQGHTGKVTGDLIDADGNRVIHVGELTVTVGRNSLKTAGDRPDRGSADGGITIEHADGNASIVIDKNGKVTITAKQDLALVSTDGNITLDAKSVDVKVQQEMNVHS